MEKMYHARPWGVLTYKGMVLHSTLELGMFLRRSYFFRSKLGWGKSQILVMNRVRKRATHPHTIVLSVLLPSPRDAHTGIRHMKVILKNNVKDRKSCIPNPHMHTFLHFEFSGANCNTADPKWCSNAPPWGHIWQSQVPSHA